MVQFVIHLVLSMCTKIIQPRFCTQATQLSRLSNEAVFRLHESRGLGSGVLEAFVEVNKLFRSENISLVYMRLENALTLTSIYAKGEAELQEASSEADLHGHSLGGTDNPSAVGWHVFWFFEDTSRLFSAGDRCHFHSSYTTTS